MARCIAADYPHDRSTALTAPAPGQMKERTFHAPGGGAWTLAFGAARIGSGVGGPPTTLYSFAVEPRSARYGRDVGQGRNSILLEVALLCSGIGREPSTEMFHCSTEKAHTLPGPIVDEPKASLMAWAHRRDRLGHLVARSTSNLNLSC